MRRDKPADSAINYRSTLGFIATELRSHRPALAVTVIFTVLMTILTSILPLILGWATNIIFEGILGQQLGAGRSKAEALRALKAEGHDYIANMTDQLNVVPGRGIDFTYLGKVCLLALVMYILSALSMWIASLSLRLVVQYLGHSMRRRIDQKIDRLPLSYIDRNARGDVLSRITNDVNNMVTSLQRSVSQILTSIFQVVGIITMMLIVSVKLTLMAVAVIPCGAVLASIFVKRARPLYRQQWKSTGQVSSVVEDSYSGHDVMALYGLEDHMLDDFKRKNNALFSAGYKAQFLSSLARPIMIVTNNLSFIIIAVAGAFMVLHGRLSFGFVQAFITYARDLNNPLESLASLVGEIQSGLTSAQRVHDFLDATEMAPDSPHTLSDHGVEKVRGDVSFHDVVFSYEGGLPVINGLSMSVQAGQTVAIVGETGSGKTTLVNLLMRFYEVSSGTITVDGVDTATVSKDALRSHFGMVLQDTWLFKGTVADNIAFGARDYSMRRSEFWTDTGPMEVSQSSYLSSQIDPSDRANWTNETHQSTNQMHQMKLTTTEPREHTNSCPTSNLSRRAKHIDHTQHHTSQTSHAHCPTDYTYQPQQRGSTYSQTHNDAAINTEDNSRRLQAPQKQLPTPSPSINCEIGGANQDTVRKRVIEAAKAVGIDSLIRHLPQGYDTMIDADGAGVSAGEKQLITIARAFLADPDVLILDEATSSVDTRTEMTVQQAMKRLRTGRTSFVIAHRLSTIRDADAIMVMDSGSIVEQGTHQELLDAGGAYATLYEAQFLHGKQL
ncbi:MAG: ABC transporter ATP-binding protein [Actinomycetaceae bacterium]|nr:ABC transporter ATP-binding protein [Actinomycetaceae bacterium]